LCATVLCVQLTRRSRRSTRQLVTGCGVASALGLVVGGIALVVARVRGNISLLPRLAFDPSTFFTYLLPPLIFNAGLSVENSLFFRHLQQITLLGVLGTLLNACVIAAGVGLAVDRVGGFSLSLRDCLAIGAVFGATDTVATLQVLSPTAAPALFALVLGEGCINDAVSLVLLRAVEAAPSGVLAFVMRFGYLLVCSAALGLALGLVASGTARYVNVHLSEASGDAIALEVAVNAVVAYVAFLLAEALGLSGILSLFTAALAISHYGLRCMSRPARSTTLNAFSTLSFLCEQIIFVYTGIAALDRAAWALARPGEVFALVASLGTLLLASRALSVAAVAAICNLPALQGSGSAAHRISFREAAVVWWAGAMRGAVSIAIATHHFAVVTPGRETHLPQPLPGTPEAEELRTHASVIAAAFLIVLLSTICMSAGTRPFLLRVMPEATVAAEDGANERIDCPWPGIEADDNVAASSQANGVADGDGEGSTWLHRAWRGMDERLAPLLLQEHATPSRQNAAYTEMQ
jgi:sodium/hydrogen exchanger-like protein 6/7